MTLSGKPLRRLQRLTSGHLAACRLPALGLLCALLPLGGASRPIDLTGRDVPFDFPAGSGNTKALSQPSTLQFSTEFDYNQANSVYGLQVNAAPGARVIINGRPLDMDPLPRSEGLLYRVPESYLKTGRNEFTITRSPDDASGDWGGTRMFSLENSTEEVHFNQMFAEEVAAAPPPAESSQSRYDVEWYDCTWVPDMGASRLAGGTSAWIGARSLDSSLQTVALDFDINGGQMIIRSVDQGPATASLPYTVDTANDRLLVQFPAPIPAGQEFRIRVTYDGTPRPSGTFGAPYRRSTHGSPPRTVVYTFSEPYGARQWWPCKDLPYDKATTTVQRIVIPSGQGWEVVSNGLLTSVTPNGDSTETWTWSNSHPVSTYLISMCVSNYVYSSAVYTSRDGQTTMPIRHAVYPEDWAGEGNGAAGTLEVMNFFADSFGEYPFLNEKYFTAAHNSGSGMEHQTCTSMPGGDVFDGRQRRNVHELAHHWFGDKITCENFNHLWLNEGFATYCEALWDEHKWGRYAYFARINEWDVSNTQPTVGPSSDNFSGAAVYRKGGFILHMLRHVVGDATFSQILRTWANSPAHSYSTAVSSDFEAVAESVSGRDLTQFFDQWLNHPTSGADASRPNYRFLGGSSRSGLSHQVSLQLNQVQSPTLYAMPLDVEIVDETGASSVFVADNTLSSQGFSFNTGTSVPCEIELDPDNWVLKQQGFSISTCGLPRAEANKPYSSRLQTSFAGGTVTWSGGSGLPAGLTLNPAGLISGTPSAAGVYSVSVTANDGSGPRSTVLNLEVIATPLPVEVIVESRAPSGTGPAPGGAYSEAGSFSDTTSKSSAPRTVGNGSRYSVAPGSSASFRPAIPVSGYYNVYITLDDRWSSPNNDANANWTLTSGASTVGSGSVYLHPYTPGLRNKWMLLASNVWFEAGAAGTVGGLTLINVDGDGPGGTAQNRFVADAVKFVRVQSDTASALFWNYE